MPTISFRITYSQDRLVGHPSTTVLSSDYQCARTDAIAVEGLNSAIERARAYVKAGADMIFAEAPETVGQIEEIARQNYGQSLGNPQTGTGPV